MHLSSSRAQSATSLRSRTASLALLAAVLGTGASLQASTFFWDPLGLKSGTGSTGAGTWDASTTADWYPGSGASDAVWTTGGDIAAFQGALAAGGATVTVSGAVSTGQVQFQNTGGHYTLSGGTINMVANSGTTITGNHTIDATQDSTITSTISAAAGVTVDKWGNGALTLANTVAGGNTFASGLVIHSGSLNYSADNNLGTGGVTITTNTGSTTATLNYTGNTNYTDTRVLTFSGNGGAINVATAGSGGGKIVFSTANTITGSGPITKSGPGWLTLNKANNNTGNWTINGGVVESNLASALGASTVTVLVNSGGELCSANSQLIPYSVTAAGGTLSGDNTDLGNFSGSVTVTAASKLRLGDFFGSTNRNLTISGKLQGSGNLSLISSLSNTPTGKTLNLTGDNSGYTGVITVPVGTGATNGYNVVLGSNLGTGGSLAVSSSAAFLTTVTIKDTSSPSNGGFIPTITTPTAAIGNGGELLYQGAILNGPLDMTTVGDGFWFLGSPAAGGSTWLPNGFKPGNGSIYRLGGGGGTMFMGNPSLIDYNSTPSSIIVGDTRTNGTGTVNLAGANTLSGNTTVVAGTLLVSNTSGSALGTGNAQLNGGTFGGNGTITGTINAAAATIAPGLNSASTTIGTLTVGAASLGASTTTQMELGGTSRGTAVTNFDALVSTGAMNYGGTLKVTTINSFAPAPGNVFDLFDWKDGQISGSFSSMQLPTLAATNARWDTSQLSVNGTIAVDAATARVLAEGTSTQPNLGTAAVTGGGGNYNLASVSIIPAQAAGEIEITGLPEQPVEVLLDVADDTQTSALAGLLSQLAPQFGYSISSDKTSGILGTYQYTADYDVLLTFASRPAGEPFQFEFDFTHAGVNGAAVAIANIGVVPEPATMTSLAGIAALATTARRRRRA
jgi:fibronectin-binding autotransporter adhesin